MWPDQEDRCRGVPGVVYIGHHLASPRAGIFGGTTGSVAGATGGITASAAGVGSDAVLGAALLGRAGSRAVLTGGANVCYLSGLAAEVGVDAVVIGVALGGESPIVIGRAP